VEDLAFVLSPDLIREVERLNEQIYSRLGFHIQIITRDFLGGANTQHYTDEVFLSKPLQGGILLVVVIGEEDYAITIGEKADDLLNKDKAENLLTTHFRAPFLKERDYDKALAAFLVNLAQHFRSQGKQDIRPSAALLAIAGVSGEDISKATAVPASEGSWLDSIFGDAKEREHQAWQYSEDARDAAEEDWHGLSLFQIAFIGFILYKIFGKKRKGRIGCGPFSWIFGTWGLSKFFRWRK
ncbi:MAG: TPM domain-containing protein, partial [Clostridiales bacterium]|nr:TPM domain-containing protein [Clostridiales bacterium]